MTVRFGRPKLVYESVGTTTDMEGEIEYEYAPRFEREWCSAESLLGLEVVEVDCVRVTV